MLEKILVEYKIVQGVAHGSGLKRINTDIMYLYLDDGKYFLYYTGNHRVYSKRLSWIFQFIRHSSVDGWIGSRGENSALRVSKNESPETPREDYKKCYISPWLAKKLLKEIKNPEIIVNGKFGSLQRRMERDVTSEN